MNSEFKQFLDILRRLGIEHTVNYGPTKKDWQRAILSVPDTMLQLSGVRLLK